MNKGLRATSKGKYSKAVKLFSKSIKINSTNLDSYLNRRTAYNDLELFDLSLKDYNFLFPKNTIIPIYITILVKIIMT